MPDIEKVIKAAEICLQYIDDGDCPTECPYFDLCTQYEKRVVFQPLIRDALKLLKVYKEKIESESEKTTLIDEALEVGRCVLRRGIYLGSDKQWIRVSMTIKEAEKIFGTMRQMKNKQT